MDRKLVLAAAAVAAIAIVVLMGGDEQPSSGKVAGMVAQRLLRDNDPADIGSVTCGHANRHDERVCDVVVTKSGVPLTFRHRVRASGDTVQVLGRAERLR
jgi:hypothetical protein